MGKNANGTYHCGNCRENVVNLKKVAIGADRYTVFCGACNCYLSIEEPSKAKPAKATDSK